MKQQYRIAERVSAISGSGIRKFFDLVLGMDDVLSLGVGEPDFSTPRHICESGVRTLQEGVTTYTSNLGLMELRQEIAAHLKRRFGVEYDPEREILVTCGVSEGFDLCMRALVNPGDRVIIHEPSYVMYQPLVRLAGGEPVVINTRAEDRFEVTPDDLRAAIRRGGSVALSLCFPSNPTGATMTRAQLAELGTIAAEHDLYVISDEIYADILFAGERTCFPALPGMKERTILLDGFSKFYAMTGWRIGYAAAPAPVIEAMVRIHQYTTICAPVTSQYAAIEALRNGESEGQRMVEAYRHRRDVMVQGLRDMGLPCFTPRGAFYVFPSIRHLRVTSEDFCAGLLEAQRVAIVPGNAFGENGEGHVRLVFAAEVAKIREALRRMKSYIEKLETARHPQVLVAASR